MDTDLIRKFQFEKLPKLSGVLETFLNKLAVDSVGPLWNANLFRVTQSMLMSNMVATRGYVKNMATVLKKDDPEDDATDEEQRNRVELRSQSAIKMPKRVRRTY